MIYYKNRVKLEEAKRRATSEDDVLAQYELLGGAYDVIEETKKVAKKTAKKATKKVIKKVVKKKK